MQIAFRCDWLYYHSAAVVGSQMMLGGVKIARDNPMIGDDVIAGRNDVTTQTEPSEKSQELSKCVSVCY